MTAKQRWSRAVAGVVLADFAVVLLVVAAPVDSAVRHLVADATSLVGAAAAVAAFAWTGWRAAGEERRWRWLMALALFLWLPAHASWTWYRSVDPNLFPNAANALYFGMPLFAFFALLRMVKGDRAAAREHGLVPSRAVGVLDGLIIVGSLLTLSWGIALEAISNPGNVRVDRLLVVASYTAADLVLIAVAILFAMTLHSVLRPPLAWLVAGLLAIGFSHVFYLYAISSAMLAPPLADVGYASGPVLFLVAALVPDRRSLRRTPRVPLLLLPYVPLAAVCAFTLFNTVSTGDPPASAVYFLVGIVALVVLRELVSLRQLYIAQQQLAYQATHDPLTGVSNRALLLSQLNRELPQEQPRSHDLALLYVDLDHFKEINDTLGHGAGDAVLRTVAERLTTCVRSTDTLARIGGDEFVVLLNPAPANPQDFARRIRDVFHESGDVVDDSSRAIGVSLGYVLLNAEDTPDQALTRADAAMYRAKHSESGISIEQQRP
ncbi:hypothetical protein GCM10027174_04570 [Salinifilum aidingensis]